MRRRDYSTSVAKGFEHIVTFEEGEHKYTNSMGEAYISGTTIIGLYKQPFDAEKVATAYAKKNGMSPEYWIELWAKGRDEACAKGTWIHKVFEDIINASGIYVIEGEKLKVQNYDRIIYGGPKVTFDKFPPGLYSEFRLWNHSWKIAGTADIVIIYPDGTFIIRDFKTNKELKFESHRFKDGSFKMMKYPVRELMDCNFYHYTLQLSLYAAILESYGLVCKGLWIDYIKTDADNTKVISREPYVVEYRKDLIFKIIKHYNSKIIL